MSRPDDIPQDVWDEAFRWLDDSGLDGPALTEDDAAALQRAISRAIAAEREACANVADEFAGQFPEYPEFDEQHNCAVYIAGAIRKRGAAA